MKQSKLSTKYLVELALLVAVILLMAFTPIGYIKTLGLEITLIVIPVAVGCDAWSGRRRNFGRRIWSYKLYSVLWNERFWNDIAWC